MRRRLVLALPLFCLPPATRALAQTCNDLLRQAASHYTPHTISAADLRIPERAQRHFERALQASERNQLDLSARESEKALAIAPQFAEVYLLRAARELHAQQVDTAIELVTTARTLKPELPWSGILMASAWNQLHRYSDAIAELERVRGSETESWQARYERARAETGLRNTEAALHWSELAIASAPVGCTDARLVRANALQLAGRPLEVVAELETYLALDRQGTHRAQVVVALENARLRVEESDRELLAMK